MTAAEVSERSERRAAPETGPALRPSKSAQADLEPRPSFPSGDRPTYPSDEGQT